MSPARLLKTGRALRCLGLFLCLQRRPVYAFRLQRGCGTQDPCIQRHAHEEPVPSVEEFVQERPSGSEVILKRIGRHAVASLSSMITCACACATFHLLEYGFPVLVRFPFPLLGLGVFSLWVAPLSLCQSPGSCSLLCGRWGPALDFFLGLLLRQRKFQIEIRYIYSLIRAPLWLSSKESACQYMRWGFDPWVRKIP